MQLDLTTLRPAYNLTALAASIIPATWWAAQLTNSATSGPFAPAGLTAAALLTTITADRILPTWLTRALLYTPITALAMSPAAAHAVLTITVGAAS